MSKDDGNWDDIHAYAQKVIAINPLLPEGHEAIADAAVERKQPGDAVASLRALKRMDPVDPASIDFRLASALRAIGKLEQSKHHVMRALVEAPRYREAHRLLLEIDAAAAEERAENGEQDSAEEDSNKGSEDGPDETSDASGPGSLEADLSDSEAKENAEVEAFGDGLSKAEEPKTQPKDDREVTLP